MATQDAEAAPQLTVDEINFSPLSGGEGWDLKKPVIDDLLRDAGFYKLVQDGPFDDVEAALRKLTHAARTLDDVGREALRGETVVRLRELGVKAPTRLVDSALRPRADADASDEIVRSDAPWPKDVDGDAVLTAIRELLNHYLVLPDHAAVALSLWCAHTFLMDVWSVSPLLVVVSPTKRCGKTTLLQIVEVLCHRAVAASNITPAALFRTIEKHTPTVLLDEYETFSRDNDELRGVINAGHARRTAYVIRLVGDRHEPKRFTTWAPKLLAMIGRPAGTIVDRAVTIEMRRRKSHETVAAMRADRLDSIGRPLRSQLRRWADDRANGLRGADPRLPTALHDRAADNWRPLVTVADAAGSDWPRLAREAAVALTGADGDTDDSAGVQLLDCQGRNKIRPDGGGKPDHLAAGSCV